MISSCCGALGVKLQRCIALTVLCLAIAPPAFTACTIAQIGELPVNIVENRVLIDGLINGHPVKVVIDTGATYTFLWEDAAARLGLPLETVSGLRLFGVGGEARVLGTEIKQLQLGSFHGKDMRLAVIGTKIRDPTREDALVLGDDFFSHFASEFDLAHGVIRLLRPEGCQPGQLAYWSKTYALAELERSGDDAQILTDVLVNGKRVRAILDTGATTSIISQRAAEGAGVTRGSAATVPAPTIAGIAGKPLESWLGTFATLSIGDEAMRNVKLRIADLFTADAFEETGSHVRHSVEGLPSMLVGCDFFLSHRLLVLAKERKLLFTYSGGPVFESIKSSTSLKDGADHTQGSPARAASAPTR
jgi:predicted aspartyl protease